MTQTSRAAGLILAGGRSSRMGGGDKGLISINGVSMLARVRARLAPQVAGIVLSANGDPKRFSALGLPVVADLNGERAGPLAGIEAGLAWAAKEGHDIVASVAADTPFFPVDLVDRMQQARPDVDVVLCASAGRDHPAFGLWPVAIADRIGTYLREAGSMSVRRFISLFRTAIVEWPAEPYDPFFNVNTPDDAAEAERLALEFGL